MSAIMKIVVGALVEALVAQLPTFTAWLERRRAAQAAATRRAEDEKRIDAFLANLPHDHDGAGHKQP